MLATRANTDAPRKSPICRPITLVTLAPHKGRRKEEREKNYNPRLGIWDYYVGLMAETGYTGVEKTKNGVPEKTGSNEQGKGGRSGGKLEDDGGRKGRVGDRISGISPPVFIRAHLRSTRSVRTLYVYVSHRKKSWVLEVDPSSPPLGNMARSLDGREIAYSYCIHDLDG
jgi:hypothetical protein